MWAYTYGIDRWMPVKLVDRLTAIKACGPFGHEACGPVKRYKLWTAWLLY